MRHKKALLLGFFIGFAALGCSISSHRTVAILPFENLSARPDDDWYKDGFSEALTDHLQYIDKLQIIPRDELNRACTELKLGPYLAFFEEEKATQIGRSVGATQVLIGSFRRRDDRLVAFSRVVDVKSGKVIHSHRQRSEALKNFLFFTEVKDIALGSLPALGTSSRKLEDATELMSPAGLRTEKLKAFEYFILGRLASFKGKEEDFRVAITWYDEAIKLDFRYALAYIGRAEALALWGYLVKQNNRPYQEFYRKSYEALARAKQYDPKIPFFHRKRFENILDADIDYIIGDTHLRNKKYDDSLAAFRKSLEKTPGDAMTIFQMGEAYLGKGDKQLARHHYASALEKNPSFVPAIDRMESLMHQ